MCLWKIASVPLPFLGVQHDSFNKTRIFGCLVTIKTIPLQQKLKKERHHPWTKTELLEDDAFCLNSRLEQHSRSEDLQTIPLSGGSAKYLYLPKALWVIQTRK